MFKKFVNAGKRICAHPKNAALHNTLKILGNNSRIKVCKFDKGKWVVILDSHDYYAKLDCIISDSSKFHEINQDTKVYPIINKEKFINYYVKKYIKSYGSETVKNFILKGSSPGKMYGLIKVHKNNNPTRPVISMIGTPEYQLAKFLDSIIKSYIPDSYILHSTDHFLDELNNFKFKANHKLVSFDVQSLFTNVPLDETINIIADYIYSKDNHIKDNLPSMKKEVFIKLLRLANQGMFLYKDKLYQQHDGVSRFSTGSNFSQFFSCQHRK